MMGSHFVALGFFAFCFSARCSTNFDLNSQAGDISKSVDIVKF